MGIPPVRVLYVPPRVGPEAQPTGHALCNRPGMHARVLLRADIEGQTCVFAPSEGHSVLCPIGINLRKATYLKDLVMPAQAGIQAQPSHSTNLRMLAKDARYLRF